LITFTAQRGFWDEARNDSVYLDQVIKSPQPAGGTECFGFNSPRYVEVCDDWLVIFQDVCGGILPQDTGEWNIQ